MNLTVSNKGSVLIPAKMRKKYYLKPGSKVVIVDYGGILSIIPAKKDPIKQGRGLLKDLPSLNDDLLKEHARESIRKN